LYKSIDINNLKTNLSFRWYLERKNFFTEEECKLIKKKIDKDSRRKEGHYGSDLDKLSSKDSMPLDVCNLNIAYFIDQKYLNKFWNVIKISNQFTYKFNIQGIFKNRYGGHRYDVGDWYTSHSDFHPIDEYSTVKLTLIVFLNDDYEGGEFQFFDGTIIEPEVGKLVIHPSFGGHQVNPVTKGSRYSCVCWAVGDTFV
jgi:PKHD-type hydroxylase